MNMARDPVEELTELFAALSLEDHNQSGDVPIDLCPSSSSSQCLLTLEPPHTIEALGEGHCSQAFLATVPSASRIRGHQVVRKRSRRKRSLAQTMPCALLFVRENAIENFARTWKLTLSAWNLLLLKTTIPQTISIADLNMSASVKVLHNTIAAREGSSLPPRFGYVQLARFLGALEERIKEGKGHGLIPLERGRVNASIAIDMFLDAQDAGSNDLLTRRKIWEFKRIGKRWETMIGPSVLLLSIYSDVAESFVYVSLRRLLFQD
jgi:hypothetical protein